MSKYIKYYESKFPENIKDLQDYNEWPFVGYNKGEDVAVFTSLQENDTNSQPDNEIWYTTTIGEIQPFRDNYCDATLISNTYENGKGVAVFDRPITRIWADYSLDSYFRQCSSFIGDRTYTYSPTGGMWPMPFVRSYIDYISLPDSVTEINELALCSNHGTIGSEGYHIELVVSTLKTLAIGPNVSIIKGNKFALEKVYFRGTLKQWNNITFVDNYLDPQKIDLNHSRIEDINSGNANPANGAVLYINGQEYTS
jgi:hypothetical protein